ncbi:MAG TPA: VOC family protein [Dongiaceae bacterium]|jgi:PhnB protein|nr:VOC family protein [Dongiaceae bacterium]
MARKVKAKAKTARPKVKAKPAKAARPSPAPGHLPAGYRSIQPYLIVDGAAKAIAFYKAAFGAKERMRLPAPGGRIGHAELEIGDSVVMLADEAPDWDAYGPGKYGGSPVSIMIYVADVDAVVKKAVKAGAKLTREVKDQFYGDRAGGIDDPFGHHWHIATHIEDVSPREMKRRMDAMATG